MNKKREECQAKYPWYSQNDPVKEQLKTQYPWLDKNYVADVTRKPNVDARKSLKEINNNLEFPE